MKTFKIFHIFWEFMYIKVTNQLEAILRHKHY